MKKRVALNARKMTGFKQIKTLFSGKGAFEIPQDKTLFHLTHWKAGSQWMRAVIDGLCPKESIVGPEYFESQVLNKPIVAGKVYSCVYLGKPEFDSLKFPGEARKFILIRDLRDTLISGYFSVRFSHSVETGAMDKWRRILSNVSEEAGLRYLMEIWLPPIANIQRTWIESGERVYRLEDFMTDDTEKFAVMLEQGWGVKVDRSILQRVLSENSFSKLAGRERGTEDQRAHYRKGVAGDWKGYFTPALTERFKTLYNDLTLGAGYEKSADWTCSKV